MADVLFRDVPRTNAEAAAAYGVAKAGILKLICGGGEGRRQ